MWIHPILLKHNMLGWIRSFVEFSLTLAGLYTAYLWAGLLAAFLISLAYMLLTIVDDLYSEAYEKMRYDAYMKSREDNREDE